MTLILPKDYHPSLTIRDTEAAIVFIRETFQDKIADKLNLQRMSAPMFVEKSTGLNDNLNGIERPVAFDMKAMPDDTIEVVHSLANWKRLALKRYGFGMHEGLYTNMNAIRRDEDLDNFHSIYVDQWDWEKIIAKEERNIETLKTTVKQIFKAIKKSSAHAILVLLTAYLATLLLLLHKNWKTAGQIQDQKNVKIKQLKRKKQYS